MPNPQNIEKHKFKKGQSGNPKGRPKKLPDLKQALAEVLGEEKETKNALTIVLMKMRAEALKGNIRAAELLLKYGYPMGTASSVVTERMSIVWGNTETEADGEQDTAEE